MTNEHTKGAISKVRGTIEEAVGKVTGDRRGQARGKVRQVQGELQEGLGDIQDAARKARQKTSR